MTESRAKGSKLKGDEACFGKMGGYSNQCGSKNDFISLTREKFWASSGFFGTLAHFRAVSG